MGSILTHTFGTYTVFRTIHSIYENTNEVAPCIVAFTPCDDMMLSTMEYELQDVFDTFDYLLKNQFDSFANCEQRSRANNTWRDNIRNLLTGKFKYYKMLVNKWITYKCDCGCNTFYIYKDLFVCSECFSEHIMNNFVITYKTKEDAEKVTMPMTGTVGMNTWHRFGLISKYEFDKFMKDCTNPEQEVYW